MSHLAYSNVLPEPLRAALAATQVPVEGVEGLMVDPLLLQRHPDLHTPERLAVLARIYRTVAPDLARLLSARDADRAFVDAYTLGARDHNRGIAFHDPGYRTVLCAPDPEGRVVVGPIPPDGDPAPVGLPDRLKGTAVTLFGPPDTAKMAINAMNALHRVRPDEPAIVTEIIDSVATVPFWGADSEDSKTPEILDLLDAIDNLQGCFDGTLERFDLRTGKHYRIVEERHSIPIKRIPGLALPDGLHQLDGLPLPLHLVDFVLHALACGHRPEALTFYVPKLENEEEAAYLAKLVATTEAELAQLVEGYQPGTIRLFIVFETPRAIFRIGEMADALHPWFAGGSLGWHDFLAATARLFKHDPNYRIPVKADPDIVIHHIKESHLTLVRALRPRGAVCIGGMYGTLFEDGNDASFRVSMVGYIRDVVTQLKRGLDGFWVAHPDFVRIGIALVEAWRRTEAGDDVLTPLVTALVPDEADLRPLLAFIAGPDVEGLERSDPLYLRRVLAADVHPDSPRVTNHTDHELRYNVFQALQYLTAWLQGTGCVALPATLNDARGEPVFVRIMDDLATTERSRWELWHEVAHGRVSVEAFDRILAGELDAIRANVQSSTKRVQVPWSDTWSPIAGRLLRQLVVADVPVESVSELLVPFTFAPIQGADDPWAAAQRYCPGRYSVA